MNRFLRDKRVTGIDYAGNIRIKSILLVSCWLLLLMFYNCGSNGNDNAKAEKLSFEVNDSLLGPAFEVQAANKLLYPPSGFASIPDSLLQIFIKQQTILAKEFANIELVGMFFDSLYNSGLMVSVFNDLYLGSDTTVIIEKYRNSLEEFYGADQVKTGDFLINDIYVKNFLITDSLYIRFQLLCLSENDQAMELHYFILKKHYQQLLKAIESSMGTIQLIEQGG